MASMAEVINKLTDREEALCKADVEASMRIREAENRVTEATEGLLQLKRTQEQERKVLKAQMEKKKRDTAYTSRARVHKAQKECAEAVALAETAEKRQRRTEGRVHDLEEKIRDLRAAIAKRTQASEVECSNVQRVMDGRYERVSSQAEGRIRSMAEHAKEVCVATGAAVQTTGCELQDQMWRANMRSEGRVRFKELCELSKSFDRIDMTKDSYMNLKGNLIDLWHIQAKSPSPVKPSCESPAERSWLSPSPSPTPKSPSPLGFTGKCLFGSTGDAASDTGAPF